MKFIFNLILKITLYMQCRNFKAINRAEKYYRSFQDMSIYRI